jgi:hypothetical protein
VRPYVVSHLNAKATQLAMGGIYFFQKESRNVHRIVGLLIKCNWFAESRNLVQQTGPYSPSLLISCSVTPGAELEGEIPSYAEHDDFLVKVPALKSSCAEVGSVIAGR